MDWLQEAKVKLKKGNQVLFPKDSLYLQDLATLIGRQNRRTIVLWALEFADEIAQALHERYPQDTRPQDAVKACRAWATGQIKMPVAQRAILDAHALAKEIDSKEDIALCHAVGQACGVVHTPGHALGLPLYELTAIIWRYGIERCRVPVEARRQEYIDRLLYWQEHAGEQAMEWAGFLQQDSPLSKQKKRRR